LVLSGFQAVVVPSGFRRGKSPAWALAADDDYERQITALAERERALTAPDALRGLIEPGPDVARRWAAAPVSARRQVARLLCSPEVLGELRVMPAPSSGHRGNAADRVVWARDANR